ncbi:MAG: glycosyltransferase family 4 protein [Kiritimatiellae bacterium]|nr:glycosyltransferase family 4 protein [Kiritimatiellia bacterium]MDD5523280.1 glycosyltransferase family 4 protein [Kiritimatiellia bacterium]
MKILVVNSHPDRSESHIYATLRKQAIDIEVICDPASKWREFLETNEVPVMRLHYQSRMDFPAIRFMREKIQAGSFELVHAVNKRSCTHVMAALTGINIPVVSYRGIIGNISRWNPETGLTYFSRKMKRIICVCEAVRQYLLSVGISEDKAVTVYKGHDISWYQPADRKSFEEFGIPGNAFVVGCAAKIRPRKGIDVLINAIKSIPEISIHLLLAGEITDPSIPALVKQMHLEKNVHLTGHRMDAPKLMGACDCFVMPSLRREGLPRAVIEAMAQGVPPILTDVGGMPEIVEHLVSGILVPHGDSGALAKAIQQLASDKTLKTSLGVGAKARVLSRFNIDRTTQAYKEIFSTVVLQ